MSLVFSVVCLSLFCEPPYAEDVSYFSDLENLGNSPHLGDDFFKKFDGGFLDESEVKDSIDELYARSKEDKTPLLDIPDSPNPDWLSDSLIGGQEHFLQKQPPLIFSTLEWINLTNTSFVASLITQHVQHLSCLERRCFSSSQSPMKKNDLWFHPYGMWNRQKRIGLRPSFDTDGVGGFVGYDRCLGSFLVGASVGYTYTTMKWKRESASGDFHRVYGALYGGYANQFFIADLLVMGGGNFYDISRKIQKDSQHYRIGSCFTGKTVNVHVDLIGLFDSFQVPIQLVGKVDYSYLYQPTIKETANNNTYVEIASQSKNMLRTELGIKYEQAFRREDACFYPYLGLSWISKIQPHSYLLKASSEQEQVAISISSKAFFQVMPFVGCKILTLKGALFAIDGRAELGAKAKSYLASFRVGINF